MLIYSQHIMFPKTISWQFSNVFLLYLSLWTPSTIRQNSLARDLDLHSPLIKHYCDLPLPVVCLHLSNQYILMNNLVFFQSEHEIYISHFNHVEGSPQI